MAPPSPGSEAELRAILTALRAHNNKNSKSTDATTADATAVVAAAAAATLPPPPLRPPRRVEGARLELPNGDVYKGDVVVTEGSNPPVHLHGRGTYTAADGARYVGGYRWGLREGDDGEFWAAPSAAAAAAAAASSPVSIRYRGPWLADLPHGSGGEAWYSDGARYKGNWAKGKRDGWGVLSRPAATAAGAVAAATPTPKTTTTPAAVVVVVYEGEWRDDCPHGRGRWTFEDGSGFFEGTFSGGVRVEGRLVVLSLPAAATASPKSSSAVVDFDYTGPLHPEDGSRHGDNGACSCPGRWEYRGGWRRGERHGPRGVCRFFADGGSRYEGPWADDQPHGEDGTWTEANGDVYRGGFVEGRREGRGVWRSSRGEECYRGGWRGGEREGQGECRYADGGRYVGEWSKGKRHGRGRMRFADGAVFDGLWEEDAWVQGAADPRFCRLRGLRRAVVATGEGPGPAPKLGGGGVDGDEEETAPGWFLIAARDELGNARLSGGDSFTVVVEGPLRKAAAAGEEEEGEDQEDDEETEAVAADVLDSGDGTYRVRLPPQVLRRAGQYRVHVTDALTGEVVAGAPLTLTVVAGPAEARRCRLLPVAGGASYSSSSSSCLRLRPGEALEARVEARDALGNAARPTASGAAAAWSLEAALAWRGPLLLQGGGSSSSSSPAAAIEGLADATATVVPLTVEADGEGWVVRGRAPAGAVGGEFLLEVVAVVQAKGAKAASSRTHLPGSPLLVVVGGHEQEVGVASSKAPPPKDEARVWAARAAAAVDDGEDGSDDGGDKEAVPRVDGSSTTEAERAYVAANPLVPVVENLRDLHLVSHVQAMRREAKELRRRGRRGG